ncbi:DUF58 domain-containing protein [Pseudoteredinibacter isoporae]|uniref:DUF58 domain-containing protein n=1 Tax=Pseudoteredinibacter isoporae TaxID=570281 RepID=UPI0031086C2B
MFSWGRSTPEAARLVDAGIQLDMDTLLKQAELSEALLSLLSQGLLGPLQGHRSGPQKGSGLDFSELAHYQPGDDVRHLDWKLSSRKQSPYVRHFQEEKEQCFDIVVDQRIDMLFGSQGESKAVVAARLAAQIGWRAIQQGDPCACSVVSVSGVYRGTSSRRLNHWFDSLAVLLEKNQQLQVSAEPQAESFCQCLEEMVQSRYRGHHVYLIGDFSGLEYPELRNECLQLLSALARHNSVRLLFVFDELEYRFPSLGFLPISDGVHHAEMNSSAPDLAPALKEAFDQRLKPLQQLAMDEPNIQLLAFDGFMRHREDLL